MSIRYDADKGLFRLETAHSCYQFRISGHGTLQHLYYGRPVGETCMDYLTRFADRGFSGNPYECRGDRTFSLDLLPQEYSCFGTGDHRTPALKTVLENGSRAAELRYHQHEILSGKYCPEGLPHVRQGGSDCETLVVRLRDEVSGLAVRLIYSVFSREDVIVRSAEISNEGGQKIVLEKAASAGVDFPCGQWDLVHFSGRHCMERQPERTALGHHVLSVGSSRGMSSHHNNPFVILCDRGATEDAGDCYGFMSVWSGSHKTEAELDQAGTARLVTGINEDGFSWLLLPGESFQTPEIILSYSSEGFNGLSCSFHRIILNNVCPPEFRRQKRRVLLNNWEATYFDFDADRILEIAAQAAELGIDLFVLDDGWFGQRSDDHAGLGDWFVNETKLPGGLQRLGTALNAMGLDFGLWLEPEMVNEDSDLFRSHPDWTLRDPDREPVVARDQLVLDMGRPEVREYLFGCIDRLLKEAPVCYLKWDFNRSVANLYSSALPAERQGETATRFMLGTYALLSRLREAHPQVMIEGCAGGGGRFDAGMLFYCPQIWCSDDTDAVQRLKIQKGTSYGYPVCTMGSHVSAVPNHQTGRTVPIGTRAVVALSGTFGYELDPRKLSEEDKAAVREQIGTFRKYSELVRDGRYYRLDRTDAEASFTSWAFVSEDRREVLVTAVDTNVEANPCFHHILLKGLLPDAVYRLEGGDGAFTGAALMYGGYTLPQMFGDCPAVLLHFIADPESGA